MGSAKAQQNRPIRAKWNLSPPPCPAHVRRADMKEITTEKLPIKLWLTAIPQPKTSTLTIYNGCGIMTA
jgi:hypothetical protein